MKVCIVRIIFEKLASRQCSECCIADFWQVRRIGLSWNFKVLQWINLNESFRLYYIHYKGYVKRFSKIRSSRFRDIQKARKVQVLNEVALIQVVRKRVSLQDPKNANTPKFPRIKIWYQAAFWRYLINN